MLGQLSPWRGLLILYLLIVCCVNLGVIFLYSLLKRMETKYIAVGVVREEICVYVSYCGVTQI